MSQSPLSLSRPLLALTAALMLSAAAPPLHAEWREVAPGIQFQEYSPDPPITFHVARINLNRESIKVVATREADRGLTVSKFASLSKAIVAINGDYFDPSMTPVGTTLSACGPWTVKSTQTKRNEPLLVVGPARAEIYPFAEIPATLPEWGQSAVSGWPMLVKGCQALSSSELPGSDSFTRAAHARTAVGLSRDKKTLYLVVVDGRKKPDQEAGITLAELGAFMQEELGVCTALNLDGGGSSTMVVRGKLASKPSTGSERVVSNHLAIVTSSSYLSCPEPATTSVASTRSKVPSVPSADLWRDLDEVLGRPGTALPGDVYKVVFPRSDLSVILEDGNGSSLQPSSSLSSSVAFKRSGDVLLMLGDFTLTADEVAPVIAALKEASIIKVALHPAPWSGSPAASTLHVYGKGAPSTLAHAIRKALDATATPDAVPAVPAGEAPVEIWPEGLVSTIETTLGRRGKAAGDLLQFAIERNEKALAEGVSLPPTIFQSVLTFQSTGDGEAVVSGELLVTTTEVGGVGRELERGGITAETTHASIPELKPRLVLLPLQGRGDPKALAATLRAAINRTNHVRGDLKRP